MYFPGRGFDLDERMGMLGVIASLVEMTIGEGGKEGEGRKNVWRGGEMGGGGWE